MIGADLDRDAIRTFRVSRIRGDIRFATRRERDFRLPPDFDIDALPRPRLVAVRRARRRGADRGAARDRLVGRARVRRQRPARGRRLRHRVREPADARLLGAAPGRPRRPARAGRAAPRGRGEPAPRARRATRGAVEARPRGRRAARTRRPPSARPGPVTPERFGLLQALLAYLLAACGEEKDAVIPAAELVERFQIPAEELEEHLSLLNLVNFGGGCYAVYAELHGDEVHVDKELWGDTFRSAPRLTPLEARAIRLALEFVGPLIAAEAHRPLDRVRKKLEETFGEFELVADARAELGQGRGGARRDADRRDPPPAPRRDRVPEGGGGDADGAPRRAVLDRAAAPALVRPHLGPHARRRAQLPARPDAERDAAATRSSSPARGSSRASSNDALVARVLYSPAVARWEVERGAQPLARRLGDQRAEGRQPGVARRRDPPLPRRGRAARAAGAAPPDRQARADARPRARRHPAAAPPRR